VLIVLLLLQLGISLPVLCVAVLRRALYHPRPLPLWARAVEVDEQLILRLAATIEGLPPSTMGKIAVAQARAGDVDAGRDLLARAERRLEQPSLVPQFLRWDDSIIPECERQSLDEAEREFAAVLLGQGPPLQWSFYPDARTWFWDGDGASRQGPELDPIGLLIAQERFEEALTLARALPRDAPEGQPAKAMGRVAIGQHSAGDVQSAWATLVEAVEVARRFSNIWPINITQSGYRERALESLAALQVQLGDLRGANRTMGLIYDLDTVDQVCIQAAFVLTQRGERLAALEFLWQMADKDRKARTCLDLVRMLQSRT
jgi:tetratricopeptide (TPR) repeat protein